jgi:predicted membrane-bound spermidine synthase
MACSIVLAGSELVFELPRTFTSVDVSVPMPARLALTCLGTALGLWLGHRSRRKAYGHLLEAMLALGLVLQLAPWLYWLGLDGRFPYCPLLWLFPGITALGLSGFCCWWLQSAFDNLQRHGAFDALVTPETVLSSGLYSVAMAMSLPMAGPLLHGTCLAVAFVVLGATATSRRLALCSSYLSTTARTWGVGLCISALAVTAAAAQQVLPLRIVHETPHPIVHYRMHSNADLKVTSAQGAFHVFNSGHLRFSTLDHARWAEALTRPALAHLNCPKRALVMSMGDGLIERELLRDACIASIDSVVRDGVTLEAARRQPWWRELTRNAWNSARVHVQQLDPARWISTTTATAYDLIIVDMPDPDDFINAKYYTRYFYRSLQQRLVPAGVLIVQATSALRSPKTFASIRATLQAAGLVTLPYRIAMTTLGEWSFILAQPGTLGSVVRPQWLKDSLLGAAETFALPPDASAAANGPVSRLHDPAVLDAFLSEGGDHAL